MQNSLASDAAEFDRFGSAVDLSGRMLAVGAHTKDTIDHGVDAGAVYLFQYGQGEWTERQRLVDSTGSASALFGWDVNLDGRLLVVGSPSDQNTDGLQTGSARLYRHDGLEWLEVDHELLASEAFDQGRLAQSVAISGDNVVIDARPAQRLADAAHFYRATAFTDCNGNGIPDQCDVFDDPNTDMNTNGILDACERLADIDGDGPRQCDRPAPPAGRLGSVPRDRTVRLRLERRRPGQCHRFAHASEWVGVSIRERLHSPNSGVASFDATPFGPGMAGPEVFGRLCLLIVLQERLDLPAARSASSPQCSSRIAAR